MGNIIAFPQQERVIAAATTQEQLELDLAVSSYATVLQTLLTALEKPATAFERLVDRPVWARFSPVHF
jgi:hypothetical protein